MLRLSTRSRYGLRAMISIARSEHIPVSCETIAECEGVSKKYLDGILGRLRRATLIKSFKGQGGGYTLARPPEEIKVSDIIRVLERGFAVVPCVYAPSRCEKAERCPTREVWCSISAAVNNTLDKLTIADLASENRPKIHEA